MLYIFNTTIIPNEGLFFNEKINIETAISLVRSNGYTSAVGHQATAELLSTLLGVKVEMNRMNAKIDQGDMALCFKLKTRLEEGVVLDSEKLASLEYEFYLIERLALGERDNAGRREATRYMESKGEEVIELCATDWAQKVYEQGFAPQIACYNCGGMNTAEYGHGCQYCGETLV